MKFSDLLGWHKETLEEEKEGYEFVEKVEEEKRKIKLTLILTGVSFLIYGSIFTSRWINSTPIGKYGNSPLTGMATAPIDVSRVGELRVVGIIGIIILILGIFVLGIGATMPSEKSLKELFNFK